jgi:SAM-dependent methyltransferase
LLFIEPYGSSAEVHQRVAKYQYAHMDIVQPERHYESSHLTCAPWYPQISGLCATATSVLDVGCGTGYLLEQLKEFPNLRRVGIELNVDRAAFARKVSGCSIHEQPIEDFQDPEGFDVIVLMDVVSHIPGFEFFAAIKRLLRPGGHVILKTGECASDVRKTDLHDWGLPDHVHFLGMSTIERIAKRYGFEISEHDRMPVSREIFAPAAFRARGRSRARDLVKRTVLAVPGALPTLAKTYDVWRGGRIFTSIIVLTPAR